MQNPYAWVLYLLAYLGLILSSILSRNGKVADTQVANRKRMAASPSKRPGFKDVVDEGKKRSRVPRKMCERANKDVVAKLSISTIRFLATLVWAFLSSFNKVPKDAHDCRVARL